MTMRNRDAAVGFGRWWKTQQVYLGLMAALAVSLFGTAPADAQPAPCTANCAALNVGDAQIAAGGSGTVSVSFTQAQAGGADDIAAIAFTLQLSDQLTLSDCDITADGLPEAVIPAGSLSNFKVVVENATCTAGRTHCLCPDGGGTPDNFINIVVYGPNPLPAPGSGPVEIPVIPSGQLMTIGLHVAGGVAGGTTIPLHVLREGVSKPQFQAYLSVGDKDAVDQTCVPQVGTPPCSGGGATSQINSTDGEVSVVAGCTGDCDGDGFVTVDEIVKMVNIALGTLNVSECLAGDKDGSGTITVDEIVQAVNNALGGCP